MDFLRNLLGKFSHLPPLRGGLNGAWCGHYLQQGSRHRLECELSQEGTRVWGRMRDLDNASQQSLLEAAAGLPPGADEQMAQQIHPLFPGQPAGPITLHSELPEHSSLEGSVNGIFVRFTKTYQGKSCHAYGMNGQLVKRATQPAPIEYTGRLSSDGRTLSGQWTIYQQDTPKGYVEGLFELVRV
jgi:hypothetical protein